MPLIAPIVRHIAMVIVLHQVMAAIVYTIQVQAVVIQVQALAIQVQAVVIQAQALVIQAQAVVIQVQALVILGKPLQQPHQKT